MQYLVQVSGEIADKQSKTYVINSDSSENARIVATQNFRDEFSLKGEAVYVKSHKRTFKAIIAFVFMVIPIFLSLISWKNGRETISISPDYISCLYGILIYSAFVVRFKGVQRTVTSWIDILFCVFIILLLSSFVKTILVTKTINLLGLTEITINTNIVLPIAIILSWLGLKTVSLICMAGIAVIALFNISVLNEAMGMICGPLYVICSYIGILLYFAIEPACLEILSNFKLSAARGIHRFNYEIEASKHEVIGVKSAITTKYKSKSEIKDEWEDN